MSALAKLSSSSIGAPLVSHSSSSSPDPITGPGNAFTSFYHAVVTPAGVQLECDCNISFHLNVGQLSSTIHTELLQHCIQRCPFKCQRCYELFQTEIVEQMIQHLLRVLLMIPAGPIYRPLVHEPNLLLAFKRSILSTSLSNGHVEPKGYLDPFDHVLKPRSNAYAKHMLSGICVYFSMLDPLIFNVFRNGLPVELRKMLGQSIPFPVQLIQPEQGTRISKPYDEDEAQVQNFLDEYMAVRKRILAIIPTSQEIYEQGKEYPDTASQFNGDQHIANEFFAKHSRIASQMYILDSLHSASPAALHELSLIMRSIAGLISCTEKNQFHVMIPNRILVYHIDQHFIPWIEITMSYCTDCRCISDAYWTCYHLCSIIINRLTRRPLDPVLGQTYVNSFQGTLKKLVSLVCKSWGSPHNHAYLVSEHTSLWRHICRKIILSLVDQFELFFDVKRNQSGHPLVIDCGIIVLQTLFQLSCPLHSDDLHVCMDIIDRSTRHHFNDPQQQESVDSNSLRLVFTQCLHLFRVPFVHNRSPDPNNTLASFERITKFLRSYLILRFNMKVDVLGMVQTIKSIVDAASDFLRMQGMNHGWLSSIETTNIPFPTNRLSQPVAASISSMSNSKRINFTEMFKAATTTIINHDVNAASPAAVTSSISSQSGIEIDLNFKVCLLQAALTLLNVIVGVADRYFQCIVQQFQTQNPSGSISATQDPHSSACILVNQHRDPSSALDQLQQSVRDTSEDLLSLLMGPNWEMFIDDDDWDQTLTDLDRLRYRWDSTPWSQNLFQLYSTLSQVANKHK